MKYILCLILVIIIISGSAMAQVEKGDSEIQASGSLISLEGVSTLILNGLYGYYYSERLVIGGGPTIIRISAGGWDNTIFGVTGFVRYNFTARDKLVPYVGGMFYQQDLSPEYPIEFFDLTFLQMGGGFKYYINEYVSYDVSANMGLSLGVGETIFTLLAGISVLL